MLDMLRHENGSAATEMALVTPLLMVLMFGSMELGNYFLTEHAVAKQVRDGARYASRLTIAEPYTCSSDPSAVFADPDAETHIINVTETGSVDGTATGRFGSGFWTDCGGTGPVTVTIRCVDPDDYAGIYSSLGGDIPVVSVSADVSYPSLFGAIGFSSGNLCLHAASEVAVAGT